MAGLARVGHSVFGLFFVFHTETVRINEGGRFMNENKIQLFENQKIRSAWDEEREEWYFSIVDVVGVLTEQTTQRGASNYWAKLKQRLKD